MTFLPCRFFRMKAQVRMFGKSQIFLTFFVLTSRFNCFDFQPSGSRLSRRRPKEEVALSKPTKQMMMCLKYLQQSILQLQQRTLLHQLQQLLKSQHRKQLFRSQQLQQLLRSQQLLQSQLFALKGDALEECEREFGFSGS